LFYRRQPKGQKHTNDLLYEDLTAVGCWALWESALKFDLDRGLRFSTLSRHKVIGAIRNEANYLRQGDIPAATLLAGT
jgi:DNA-directed RNA polymerase specialized sigma subunit